ncbi:MAG: hypothetical protein J5656_06015 [Clostridia bacterium]|nr:hypothetical protein [Clostridia bacterium]
MRHNKARKGHVLAYVIVAVAVISVVLATTVTLIAKYSRKLTQQATQLEQVVYDNE